MPQFKRYGKPWIPGPRLVGPGKSFAPPPLRNDQGERSLVDIIAALPLRGESKSAPMGTLLDEELLFLPALSYFYAGYFLSAGQIEKHLAGVGANTAGGGMGGGYGESLHAPVGPGPGRRDPVHRRCRSDGQVEGSR